MKAPKTWLLWSFRAEPYLVRNSDAREFSDHGANLALEVGTRADSSGRRRPSLEWVQCLRVGTAQILEDAVETSLEPGTSQERLERGAADAA